MVLTSLSIDMQTAVVSAAAAVRNGTKFSQYNMAGEAFHGLGIQDVKSFILAGALFPLDGGRRRKGKKKEKKEKNCHVEGGSPWGWTHLAGYTVVTAVRCN
jgi:hypothetical protein